MLKVVAFVVSFLGVGSGHVLVGRWRRALLVVPAWCAVLFAARWTPVALLAMLPFVIGVAIDAAVIAPRNGSKPLWGHWLLYLGALTALNFGARRLILEAFKIPASSMSPTLLVGDHIMVDKLDRDVERGDVIVFIYPREPDKTFVKRAVALAGDRVATRGGKLLVNGKVLEEEAREACSSIDDDPERDTWMQRAGECVYEKNDGRRYRIVHHPGERTSRYDFPFDADELVVPPGTVFVIGDNRENSHDSRYWGPLPLENVLGTVLYVWWSGNGLEGIRWDRLGERVF